MIRTIVKQITLAALLAAALAACSPYDPSLPPTPFLCGDQEPRCPEGYVCVADDDRQVCRAEGTVADAGVGDAATRAR
jgi:hypothetical protein